MFTWQSVFEIFPVSNIDFVLAMIRSLDISPRCHLDPDT